MSIPKSFATIAILPDVDEISPLSCNNINVIVNTLSEETAGAAAGNEGVTDDIPLLGALPGTNMQNEPQEVVQDNTNTKKSNPNGNGQDQILEQQIKDKSIFNVCQNITPNAFSGGDTTQSTQSEQEVEIELENIDSNEG